MKTFKLVTKVSDLNEILHKDVIIIDIPVLLVPINITLVSARKPIDLVSC